MCTYDMYTHTHVEALASRGESLLGSWARIAEGDFEGSGGSCTYHYRT